MIKIYLNLNHKKIIYLIDITYTINKLLYPIETIR